MTGRYDDTGLPDIGNPGDEILSEIRETSRYKRAMAFGALEESTMSDEDRKAIVEMVWEVTATSEGLEKIAEGLRIVSDAPVKHIEHSGRIIWIVLATQVLLALAVIKLALGE